MQTWQNEIFPDNGYSINFEEYFHMQRTAASHNSPVFIDLFCRRPRESDRGTKKDQVARNCKMINFFWVVFKEFS